MTVHLISVGVSLLDRMQERTGWEPAQHRLLQERKPWQLLGADHAAAARLGDLAVPGPARDDLQSLVDELGVRGWGSRISAEQDTFTRDLNRARPLGENHVALLLCTDTAPGMTSGLWNGIALVGGNVARVRFHADAALPLSDTRGNATVVRIPDMHIGDANGFRKAMRAVGMLGRHVLDGVAGAEEDIRCHLSGGYKAAIPYLIGMAEGMRSHGDGRQVSAVVLHESVGSAPINLPLRRIPPGLARRELGCFDSAGRRVRPLPSTNLEGWAYESIGEVSRLTAYGEGLRLLLRADEGLGG